MKLDKIVRVRLTAHRPSMYFIGGSFKQKKTMIVVNYTLTLEIIGHVDHKIIIQLQPSQLKQCLPSSVNQPKDYASLSKNANASQSTLAR